MNDIIESGISISNIYEKAKNYVRGELNHNLVSISRTFLNEHYKIKFLCSYFADIYDRNSSESFSVVSDIEFYREGFLGRKIKLIRFNFEINFLIKDGTFWPLDIGNIDLNVRLGTDIAKLEFKSYLRSNGFIKGVFDIK